MCRIFCIPEFNEWFDTLTAKIQGQIQARLYRITEFGHFGDAKKIGGNKNSQRGDIAKAKKLLNKVSQKDF